MKFSKFIDGKDNAAKLEAAKEFASSSGFAWLLQVTYGQFQICPQLPSKLPDAEPLAEPMRFETLIRRIQKLRQEFKDEEAVALMASFLKTYPEKESLLRQVVGKSFGPTISDLEKAIGKSIVIHYSIGTTAPYRSDFVFRHPEWSAFAKRKGGSLAAVVKMGSFVEVYSKSGNVYRIFDQIRREFSKIALDGIFEGQLWYENEAGQPDQTEFLRQTAKKTQSTAHFFEIFDYASTFELINPTGMPYSDRMALLGAQFAALKMAKKLPDRISVAQRSKTVKDSPNLGKDASTYIMADDISYSARKPKDFLEW